MGLCSVLTGTLSMASSFLVVRTASTRCAAGERGTKSALQPPVDKYHTQVWDAFGRLLFQSVASDNTITSVAWRPDGELFAVGTFNQLSVCDKRGVPTSSLLSWTHRCCSFFQWAYSREKTDSGSVLDISWTSDGTQFAGAGASGAVVFGQLVDR